MKIKALYIILITLTLLSCGKKDLSKEFYEQKLAHFETLSSFDYVIILPGLGCQGCISEVEEYVKNNIERKDIFFILTSIESLKMLQNKIGVDLRNRNNVLIDFDNEFLLTTNQSIYPIILSLQESKINRLDYVSPESKNLLVDIVKWDD